MGDDIGSYHVNIAGESGMWLCNKPLRAWFPIKAIHIFWYQIIIYNLYDGNYNNVLNFDLKGGNEIINYNKQFYYVKKLSQIL